MNMDAQRSEMTLRWLVTAAAIALVLMAGGRTRWNALAGAAVNAAEESARTGALLGSTALIGEAVLRGDIDDETALVYRVYAVYGDERLPAEYRAISGEELDPAIVCEVAAVWDGLSDGTRTILAPFLALSTGDAAGLVCVE